jgi:hypothetical protein
MSLFEFVSVIPAVVLALCLGQLLLGVSALVKARRRVSGFLPHTIWMGILFLLILQHWWAQWDFREVDWTYPAFLYVVLGPTLLLLAVSLLIPETSNDGLIDLRNHFQHVRRLFMAVMFAFVLVTWFDGALIQGQSAFGPIGWLHLGWLGVLLVGLSTEDSSAQLVLALAGVGLLAFATTIRFFPGALG